MSAPAQRLLLEVRAALDGILKRKIRWGLPDVVRQRERRFRVYKEAPGFCPAPRADSLLRSNVNWTTVNKTRLLVNW